MKFIVMVAPLDIVTLQYDARQAVEHGRYFTAEEAVRVADDLSTNGEATWAWVTVDPNEE
jgi:hypothetical protein